VVRKMISLSCARAFVILLCACVAGYGQTTASMVSADPNSQTGVAPARLTLQSATDLLIQNNLAVVAARYNVDILRAQRIAAGLRPHPSLTFSATQFTIPRVITNPRELITSNEVNGAANTTYTLEADQLIERGNKRQLRISQAELNTQAAEAQVKDTLRQQVFQLRQAFFTAVLARENLTALQENLEHFDRTENLLIAQVREGYTAGVDLKRVQLQRLQFANDVSSAQQAYQQSLRDVFNLIGAGDRQSFAESTLVPIAARPSVIPGLDASLEAVDGSLDIIPTLLWIDDLRQMALANRPDVQAADLAVRAAEQGVALAEAQRARDVTVGAQYSRVGSDNTVGVVVGVPIRAGRFADAAIAQATAAQLQSQAQFRQARNQALTEVEKAFCAYNVSREKLRLFTDGSLKTAADVRHIEELAYHDGAKSLLDYLDAQRTYNQTLVGYNQARFDFLMSLYQLELATGTTIVK
jgi:cobalt-zinc-cadmium efflux system outer membrane protein